MLFINYTIGIVREKFKVGKRSKWAKWPQRFMGLCHVRSEESAAVPLVKHTIRHFII